MILSPMGVTKHEKQQSQKDGLSRQFHQALVQIFRQSSERLELVET